MLSFHDMMNGGDLASLADLMGHESVETTKAFHDVLEGNDLGPKVRPIRRCAERHQDAFTTAVHASGCLAAPYVGTKTESVLQPLRDWLADTLHNLARELCLGSNTVV